MAARDAGVWLIDILFGVACLVCEELDPPVVHACRIRSFRFRCASLPRRKLFSCMTSVPCLGRFHFVCIILALLKVVRSTHPDRDHASPFLSNS